MLEILFLGTGASVPSRDRVMPCVAVRHGSDIILFDCGEGSQRQLMLSHFSFMKVVGIFITHMHGDHILGLPGLLQTMSLSGRKEPLIVCGPKGFGKGLNAVLSVCEGAIEYPLEIKDLECDETVRFEGFEVSSFSNEHNVPSLGYIFKEDRTLGRFDKKKAMSFGIKPGPDYSRLQNGESVGEITSEMVMGPSRKGCTVVYSGDTIPCTGLTEASRNADVLIHESTFSEKHLELAKEHWHSTAAQAAATAKECGCKALMLTHTSNRYDDKSILKEEAMRIFENVFLPNDLDMYRVSDNDVRLV